MFTRTARRLCAAAALAIVALVCGRAGAFEETFGSNWALYEAGSMSESSSPDWWINSGARIDSTSGLGRTIQGNLPANDRWRIAYSISNPRDTANGYRPQNLLRPVTRSRWLDFREGFYFRVRRTDSTSTPYRNGSNGILIFSRYVDSDNLYYAGLRVDGTAVVKKKSRGAYYLLGQTKVLPGTYDPVRSPNLLPLDRWTGIKVRTITEPDGSVLIEVYWNRLDGLGWRRLLEAVDTGAVGGPPIDRSGFAGIRTDFMDVEFDGFVLAPLS
jgi:hypothetical protein